MYFQALYQHDAAARVIARLIQERDEARRALSSLEASASHSSRGKITSQGNGDSSKDAMTSVVAHLAAVGKELSSGRKKREIPAGVPEIDDVQLWNTISK